MSVKSEGPFWCLLMGYKYETPTAVELIVTRTKWCRIISFSEFTAKCIHVYGRRTRDCQMTERKSIETTEASDVFDATQIVLFLRVFAVSGFSVINTLPPFVCTLVMALYSFIFDCLTKVRQNKTKLQELDAIVAIWFRSFRATCYYKSIGKENSVYAQMNSFSLSLSFSLIISSLVYFSLRPLSVRSSFTCKLCFRIRCNAAQWSPAIKNFDNYVGSVLCTRCIK